MQLPLPIPVSLLLSLLLLPLLLYHLFLYPLHLYIKFSLSLGFSKVILRYRPFLSVPAHNKHGIDNYGTTNGYHLATIIQHPLTKIIVSRSLLKTEIIVTDLEMIRKINYQYLHHLEKSKLLVFREEIKKGLLFSEGEEWKKTRGITSAMFHFEMLKEKIGLMEEVVERKSRGLEAGVDDLFKFGREIAGEIVTKSLLGDEFYEIRFDGRNPYEQAHDILQNICTESFSISNILRILFNRPANKNSTLLTLPQTRILNRLIRFKQTTSDHLLKQKLKYQSNQPVASLLESYFKLPDSSSYFQQIIQQFFLFLFAGEDTVGSAIEICLALLATYPEYQSRILQDTHNLSPSYHTSKELNNFISEALRLYPVINISFPRKVIKPFTIDGVDFLPGYKISLMIGAPMVNPLYWDNPKEFKPERWGEKLENPGAFLGFMSGPRNCIGQHMGLMEVRMALVGVLRRYRLEKVGQRLDTSCLFNVINHMVEKKYVKFVKREES